MLHIDTKLIFAINKLSENFGAWAAKNIASFLLLTQATDVHKRVQANADISYSCKDNI